MDRLFSIIDKTTEESGVRVSVRLDERHPVYQAHFPGHPITPGAVLLQICEDLLPDGKLVTEIKSVKFVKPNNPLEHPLLNIRMTTSASISDFVISDDQDVIAKIKLLTD
ncbi:MAG: hypothetical protein KBT20_06370 [Bacteroidales bacterium]|nr:hypothetical protein [Candidatus Liminaster caballi]